MTVISSDIFKHDDYVRSYLRKRPDLHLGSVIKILLSYCINPILITGMDEFKTDPKGVNLFMFEEIFRKIKGTKSKITLLFSYNGSMDNEWKIELYENARGEKPIEDFFDSLDKKARLKIVHAFELLEAFGLEGGYPHVKKLTGTHIWEYRILGSDSIRIFYASIAGKIFLILHGFKKKKQKTPAKEIKTAQERLQEYILRKSKNSR